MGAEITVGKSQLIAQKREVDFGVFFQGYKSSHDSQPRRLVNDFVDLVHRSSSPYHQVDTGGRGEGGQLVFERIFFHKRSLHCIDELIPL